MYARDARGDTPLGLSVKQGHPLKRLTDEEFQVLKFTETSKEELVIPPGINACIYHLSISLTLMRF
jgi:hypothetical protein